MRQPMRFLVCFLMFIKKEELRFQAVVILQLIHFGLTLPANLRKIILELYGKHVSKNYQNETY